VLWYAGMYTFDGPIPATDTARFWQGGEGLLSGDLPASMVHVVSSGSISSYGLVLLACHVAGASAGYTHRMVAQLHACAALGAATEGLSAATVGRGGAFGGGGGVRRLASKQCSRCMHGSISGSAATASAWGPGVGLWCLVCCWDKQPPGSMVVQVRPLPIPYLLVCALPCPGLMWSHLSR
jgi:hypothetical protein